MHLHQQRIVILPSHLKHGALGFIPKSSDAHTLGVAMKRVLEGFTWAPDCINDGTGADDDELRIAERVRELTPQQFRVLQMVSSGQLNKQIAYDLNVSEATIKAHMTHILRKLGASNRTQAVLIASRLGIPDDPKPGALKR